MTTGVFRCGSCGAFNRVAAERAGPKCGRCHAALRTDGSAVHLSDDELERAIQSSPVPVLVDFWAEWCGPCRMLGPVLEELGRKHAGKVLVAKVDTQRHQRAAAALGVEGIPALFLYKGGRVVDRASGYRPLPAWEQMLAPHL